MKCKAYKKCATVIIKRNKIKLQKFEAAVLINCIYNGYMMPELAGNMEVAKQQLGLF